MFPDFRDSDAATGTRRSLTYTPRSAAHQSPKPACGLRRVFKWIAIGRCTKPRTFDAALCRERHRVEFLFNRLKRFRRVATRHEKTARNHLAMVHIGCIRVWARFEAAA